jgi:putative nucleotidyltransferase with HDIG domain
MQATTTWFQSYVARFFQADGTLPPMQQLKYDHSLRVSQNAVLIAEALGLSPERVRLSNATGLLHDVGRFTQYAEFKTFDDSSSINHAQRSHQVLLEEKESLESFSAQQQKAILDAVLFHNSREMPRDLAASSLEQLGIVRDADKLDIFYVVDDAIRNQRFKLYPEILLRVDVNGPPTPAIVEALRQKKPISYTLLSSLVDFLLIHLNWMYDLNTLPARRLVLERNVIDRIAEHLPKTAEMSALLDRVRTDVEREAQ